MTPQNTKYAATLAYNWLKMKPVFLDTETTGIGYDSEVCDLAIVNYDGKVLFDSLIRPYTPIPAEVTAIHHITDEMVSTVPPINVQWEKIQKILSGRIIITYNADYDIRMLYQAAEVSGVKNSINFLAVVDAMQLYAMFYGEINPSRGTYKWHKLEQAAKQCRIEFDQTLHRALADTVLTIKVFQYMANEADSWK
jgi:DNA polymerase III epsilon subunit-like protein